jgi:hypothetical protein
VVRVLVHEASITILHPYKRYSNRLDLTFFEKRNLLKCEKTKMEKPKKVKEHLLTEKRVYESFKNLKSVMRRTV